MTDLIAINMSAVKRSIMRAGRQLDNCARKKHWAIRACYHRLPMLTDTSLFCPNLYYPPTTMTIHGSHTYIRSHRLGSGHLPLTLLTLPRAHLATLDR